MEGEEKADSDSSSEMTVDEIVRIVGVAVGLGISKVKLTGGEPLMRKDLPDIVKRTAAIAGLTELSMTTNGTMLASVSEQLRANGLNRVNITLPTLDKEIYDKLTGAKVEHALEGVKAAVDAGLFPVKLNTPVLKGINDYSIPGMIEFARETGAVLQLIELEPINVSPAYYSAHHKPLEEYENMLKEVAVKAETRRYMQNRRVYHLPDVKVETIHPIENTEFCMHCTRLRVTSDGKLKPCLMTNDNLLDVLTPLRGGASDEELGELFRLANRSRQPYNRARHYA